MELPLVVGVDRSGSSRQAVDWAVNEAARLGLPPLIRLVDSDSISPRAPRQTWAERPGDRS